MSQGGDHTPSLWRNILWMAGAESAARVTRIVAALALAYALSPAVFGAAALVMTVADLMRTPTRNGVLQSIVRAEPNELPGVLATATRLNWLVHLGLAALQCVLAFPLARFMGAPEIAWPLVALSGIFFFYPIVFDRVAMLHRAGRMKQVAAMMTGSLSMANLATAALALLGFGIWSVVLPRLISALLWVAMGLRFFDKPQADHTARASWRAIFGFGQAILGAEILKSMRMSLDKIIVGKLLGMEVLGIYAFAFNAGLGLSQSLLKGFSDALYPYLCAQGRDGDTRAKAVRMLGVGVGAAALLFGTQALLAEYYVPMLFGEQWIAAVPVLAILCLSAVPQPLWEISAQYLRAEGKPMREFWWSGILCAAVLAGVAIGASAGGAVGAAIGVLVASALVQPLFALSVFRKQAAAPAQHEEYAHAS